MQTPTLDIKIQKIAKSNIEKREEGLKQFGRQFADHMFIADFKNGEWTDLRIVPYDKIPLSPSISAIHYGQSIFEGMKAYKSSKGEILVFRPEKNWDRLNKSAQRMCMPEIPKDIFFAGLNQLLNLDREWVSDTEGASLYIRPFMFATDEYIGVKPSETYKFIIFTAPVGNYYTEPVKVKIETHYSRAYEGGTGSAKAAGNYASALYPAKLGQIDGYHQLVWTDAKEHKYFEESGTMNIMFVVGNKILTPALGNTVLHGITRDSVLTLARSWGMTVEERKVSIEEILAAHKSGELKEMFGTGTAATIAQIKLFNYEGKDYELPPFEKREFSNKIMSHLDELKRGKIEDPLHWVVKI